MKAEGLFHTIFRLLCSLLAGLGLLLVLITFTPLTQKWTLLLTGSWHEPPAGANLVVVGSDLQADGQIGLSSYQRCVYAVRFWRSGRIRKIIVAGGIKPNSIASTIKVFLVAQGVPQESILLEEDSRNTFENIRNSRLLAEREGGDTAILTSDYHMRRSAMIAHKMGWKITPCPVPDVLKMEMLWFLRWHCFVGLVMETAKYPVYAWRGWI